MIIHKITTGYVVQCFDTKTKKFVSQEFVAGDDCSYENACGEVVEPELLEVDGQEVYLPYDMLQPQDSVSEA